MNNIKSLLTWREAALRLGEEFGYTGPDNYYGMKADEWLAWAIPVIRERLNKPPMEGHCNACDTWELCELNMKCLNQPLAENIPPKKECVRCGELRAIGCGAPQCLFAWDIENVDDPTDV